MMTNTALRSALLNRANRTRQLARLIWAPIILLEAYLAFTVLVFLLGPIDWYVPSALKLIVFLVVNYTGLYLGYRWGVMKKAKLLANAEVPEIGLIEVSPRVMQLILWSMLLTICFTTVRLLSIRGGFSEVLATLLNPGEAYNRAQEIAQLDRDRVQQLGLPPAYRWGFRISTLLAVFNGLYFPIALACWRQMSIVYRALFVITLGFTLIFAVGIGAQSGIGFLIFSALPVVLYKIYVGKVIARQNGRSVAGARSQTWKGVWLRALSFVSIGILVATVVFFQVDRQESTGRRAELSQGLVGAFGMVSDKSIVPGASERLNFGLVMLCFYVSHGYEGLALAMELPFEWMYGTGWSKAIQVILSDYLGGRDLFEKSYLARNEAQTGWPASHWWSTIFPWLASDTTFYGTVLFMILAGYILGRYWIDTIITGNPFGFAVLAQMFILVFMFPANNALAQTLDALFSLVGVFALHRISRRYLPRAGVVSRPGKAPAGSTSGRVSAFANAASSK